MAFTNIYNSDDQKNKSQANPLDSNDQEGNTQQDPLNTSGNPGQASTGTPVSPVQQVRPSKLAAGSATSSGRFTDLNKYVQAQGQGPKIGQRTEGKIAENVNAAKIGITEDKDKQLAALPKINTFDTEQADIDKLAAGGAARDDDAYKSVSGLLNQKYTGPTAAQFNTNILGKIQDIEALSDAAKQNGNQSVLLQKTFGGQRTGGINKLDSALLNIDPTSKQNLNNISQFGKNLRENDLGSATTAIQNKIDTDRGLVGSEAIRAKAALEAATGGIRSKLGTIAEQNKGLVNETAGKIKAGQGDINFLKRNMDPTVVKEITDAAAQLGMDPDHVIRRYARDNTTLSGGAGGLYSDEGLTNSFNTLQSLLGGKEEAYTPVDQLGAQFDLKRFNEARQNKSGIPTEDSIYEEIKKNGVAGQSGSFDDYLSAAMQGRLEQYRPEAEEYIKNNPAEFPELANFSLAQVANTKMADMHVRDLARGQVSKANQRASRAFIDKLTGRG